MGGATPVHNGKKHPMGSPQSVSEKLPIFNLVSSGKDFVPPFQNTDQLLQIHVKYAFDSYCIITSLVLLTQY